MDEMRDEFDKAFGGVFEKIEMTPDVAENIRNTMLQLYSVGWYDSRAALVVKLPDYHHEFRTGNQVYRLTEMKGALKEAGVRYE